MAVVAAMNRIDINADVLCTATLHRDIFRSPVPLDGWMLPQVPSFVPDALFMFPILSLTGGDVLVSYSLYAVAYFLFLAGATVWLALNVIRPTLLNGLIATLCVLVWTLVAGRCGIVEPLSLMILPQVHGGTVPMGIVVVALTLRMLRRGWGFGSALLWTALSAAATASDAFFVLHFLVPLLVGLLMLSYARLVTPKNFLCFGGLAAVSFAAAGAGLAIVRHAGLQIVTDDLFPPVMIQLTKIGPLFDELTPDLLAALRCPAFLLACAWIAISLVVVVWLVVKLRRRAEPRGDSDRSGRLGVLFCLVVFLLSAGVSCVFAFLGRIGPERMLVNITRMRYLLPIAAFSLVAMTVLVTLWHDAADRRWKVLWHVLACGVIVCLYLAADGRGRYLPRFFAPRAPAYVAEIDRMSTRFGVTCGLDRYWRAAPTSLLSRRGVRVDPVGENLDWYWPVSNLRWCFEPPGTPGSPMRPYQFILVDEALSERKIIERFGEPAARYDGATVHALIYNRRSDVAFRNFLRLPVLHRLHEDFGSRVRTPAELGLFRHDGFPVSYPGNVVVPPHTTLTVTFDPPAKGDVFEIAGEAGNSWEVEFFSGDRSAGSVRVGAVAGPEIQRRILFVPPEAAARGVSRIGIRSLREDAPSVLGHVAVYPDSRRAPPASTDGGVPDGPAAR